MPAPRVTMFMEVGKFGWTETHWSLGAQTTKDTIPLAVKLAKYRGACLGKGAKVTGVRISLDEVFRDSKVILEDDLDVAYSATVAGAGGQWDRPDRVHTALLLRGEAGDRHRKSIYMCGYPDNCVTEKPDNVVYDPTAVFIEKLKGYIAFLKDDTAKWGFRTRKNKDEGAPMVDVTAAVLDNLPPGNLGVKVASGGFAVAVNDRVQLSNFKMLRGVRPSANGQYQVERFVAGANGADDTIFLRHSGGVDPAGIEIFGKIQKVAYQVLGYTDIGVVSVTHRKRGGRTTLPLGRARSRK